MSVSSVLLYTRASLGLNKTTHRCLYSWLERVHRLSSSVWSPPPVSVFSLVSLALRSSDLWNGLYSIEGDTQTFNSLHVDKARPWCVMRWRILGELYLTCFAARCRTWGQAYRGPVDETGNGRRFGPPWCQHDAVLPIKPTIRFIATLLIKHIKFTWGHEGA